MPTISPKTTPYYGGGQVENPANVIKTSGSPSSNILEEGLGTLAVDNATGTIYGLASKSGGSATWAILGGGSSDVSSLTGNSGGAISPSGGTITLSGGTLSNFVGSGSTLTLTPKTNGYPSTPYVVGSATTGGYTTIQSALDAANTAGGGIVVVQPGNYTENLTLYSHVHIMGLNFADAGGGVNITGVHTPPASGGFVFRNVRLISATHIFNSVDAGTAHIVVADTEIEVTNGYTFNLPNWTGKLESFDVNAAVGTNDGYVNNTGGAEVDIFECSVGSGSVNPMIVSGTTLGSGANIYCPIQFQTGSNAQIDFSYFANSLTFSNNSTGTITTSHINAGANAAITMSSSGSWNIYTCIIDSSNNPAIDGAGAGTLTLGDVTFANNAVIAGTLTTAWGVTKTGELTASGNVVINTAGNGLQVKSGSNARVGVGAVLSGGTLAVANTSVTANTVVLVSITALGTVSAPQALYITKNAGVGFTVTSADGTDTSTFDWFLLESV